MTEKLTYYTILPWRTITETHIYVDNPLIIRYDDEKIVMREPNSREDEFNEFIYHRRKEPLIERLREAFYKDVRIAQEELEKFEKQYS